MSASFYVPPEQLIRDRAEFARKGIARGRSVVVLGSAEGIVLVAENPSTSLHKIAEIYDRIGFAAVGKFNEFEQLRQAGVRYADLRGYTYDRADVTARGLANAYAQTLAGAFTTESKPLEVELIVAELGHEQAGDRLYRIAYDGSILDEQGFVCLGGATEPITAALRGSWRPDLSRIEALELGVAVLGAEPEATEAAILDRGRLGGRTFRRLSRTELSRGGGS